MLPSIGGVGDSYDTALAETINGLYKAGAVQFRRLRQAGVFELFFETLASLSRTAYLAQMFDSTVVRAYVSAAGAKGGQQGQVRRAVIRTLSSASPARTCPHYRTTIWRPPI
ncbi:transposase [Xanthobacter agilis]|uniref:Transposase n=1 Tax=Xanthobacter agilis TaxID=47492 RepID=A0ABU0LHL6_XANAG|nr:transposase [Xanthobacter agilis]